MIKAVVEKVRSILHVFKLFISNIIKEYVRWLGIFLIVVSSFLMITFYSIIDQAGNNTNISQFFIFKIWNNLENFFYDTKVNQIRDKDAFEDRIVLAAIDDESIREIGRFPWTRTKWAELVDKLNVFGARTVAFDVFFFEPEIGCNVESPDIAFANSIKRFQEQEGRKIILPFKVETLEYSPNIKEMYETTVPVSLLNDLIFFEIENEKISSQLKKSVIPKGAITIDTITDANPNVGSVGEDMSPDGVFREYKLIPYIFFSEEQDMSTTFNSLTLATYTEFLNPSLGDRPKIKAVIKDEQLHFQHLSDYKIYVNYAGITKIKWFGGPENFPTVSIRKILSAKNDDKEMIKHFKDKIIFIASNAFGAHDLRNSPIAGNLPGVYWHMNMLKMLLDKFSFKASSESTIMLLILTFIPILILMLIGFFKNAILDLFTLIFFITAIIILDVKYLYAEGYDIKLFTCIFSIFSCYMWNTFLNFYVANKEKKQIRGTFSRFVAPSVVNKMLDDPSMVKVGGEKKNITVFFSDVRDFTTISERLTPEELSKALNQYMGVMTDIIFDNHGTLDKYIGDAIVAFWGAPVGVENHAYHAVKAALKMHEELPKINAKFREQNFPEFKHGVGLNTGDCSVGNMGSDKIFSYTALGDNMNLGARLESLCKFYGVQLNISEFTLMAIPEELRKEFKYRILDKMRVKGKETAVTNYEVFHPSHKMYNDDDAIAKHNLAFDLYQKQEFKKAIALFEEILKKYPDDKASHLILDRSLKYLEVPPPPNWDGVTTHKEK